MHPKAERYRREVYEMVLSIRNSKAMIEILKHKLSLLDSKKPE